MQPEIMSYLEKLLPLLKRNGFILTDEKPINYGIQLKLEKKGESIPLSIYYSKKKGISQVAGGSPKNRIRTDLEKLINQPSQQEIKLEHNWQNWLGTDESGKGDFFGPLIAAGFYGQRKILPYLQQIGVMDSKKLNDTQIDKIARQLYASYFDNIKVITLIPETYNLRYMEMKKRGRNLNDLLAWMHARIIVDLHQKYQPQGIIIDKFTTDGRMRASLQQMKNISFINKTKAEEDLFVAAASIIARFHFRNWFHKTEKITGCKIPRGAGSLVDQAAAQMVKNIGLKDMNKFVKVHFSNYNKLI